MRVLPSKKEDIPAWLNLAREVEPLFGPMADEEPFKEALIKALDEGNAFCIKESASGNSPIYGGVVIAPAGNEIAWLAVSTSCRRQGAGTMLLTYAVERLDCTSPVKVVTFADAVLEGLPARKLYWKFGFRDREPAGKNPAGFPVVLMVRESG